MASLKIASLNCQGIADPKKRRDIFQYLRNKKFDLYLLQDTHFDNKMVKRIIMEWGYECFIAPYSTQSRGVAILFNNTFEYKSNKVIKDKEGNCVIINFK